MPALRTWSNTSSALCLRVTWNKNQVGLTCCLFVSRENLYIVKTLREFVYVDDEGKDQGANGEHRSAACRKSSHLMFPEHSPTKGERHYFSVDGP